MAIGRILLGGLVVGVAAWALTKSSGPTGWATPGDETFVDYRGHQIAISAVNGSGLAKPWRWRILDGDGEAVANAVDWAATKEEAEAAGRAYIDATFPTAPKVPEPDAADAATAPPASCVQTVKDGAFAVCVFRAGMKWGYRVDAPAPGGSTSTLISASGFSNRIAARVAALKRLAENHPTSVVPEPVTRNGLTMRPDGSVVLDNVDTWQGWATPWIAQALAANQGAEALVVSVLARAFPAVNPFRLRPNGDPLAEVAQRVVVSGNDPGRVARNMFGPYTAGVAGG